MIRHSKVCQVFLPSPCSVEVRLHEPLWKVQFSPDDVAIEILTLCSQLEPLCKKEYAVRIKVCLLLIKLVAMHKRCKTLKLTDIPPFYFN